MTNNNSTTKKGEDMLVLGRRLGQSIMINDNIRITLIKTIGRNQIAVGIVAPKEIKVHRQEVYDRIQLQKTELIDTKK